MKSTDVEDTLNKAMVKSSLKVDQKPRLLKDNGSCYIANDIKAYLKSQNIQHVRGSPNRNNFEPVLG